MFIMSLTEKELGYEPKRHIVVQIEDETAQPVFYNMKDGKWVRMHRSINKSNEAVIYYYDTRNICHGVKINRIVAENFLEKPDDCNYVGYKNGDTLDNSINNLYWKEHISTIKHKRKNMVFTKGNNEFGNA